MHGTWPEHYNKTIQLSLLEAPGSHGVGFFMNIFLLPRLVLYETLEGDLDAVSSLSHASTFLLLHAFDSSCMLNLLCSGSRPRGPWHWPALSEDKYSGAREISACSSQRLSVCGFLKMQDSPFALLPLIILVAAQALVIMMVSVPGKPSFHASIRN